MAINKLMDKNLIGKAHAHIVTSKSTFAVAETAVVREVSVA